MQKEFNSAGEYFDSLYYKQQYIIADFEEDIESPNLEEEVVAFKVYKALRNFWAEDIITLSSYYCEIKSLLKENFKERCEKILSIINNVDLRQYA